MKVFFHCNLKSSSAKERDKITSLLFSTRKKSDGQGMPKQKLLFEEKGLACAKDHKRLGLNRWFP